MFNHYKFYHRKMAAVELSKLDKSDKDELVCSYAALMLHDDGVEITVSNETIANLIKAEKLNKIIKASGNEVEPYWPMLFAKALKDANIGDMLSNVAAAPAAGGAGPAAAATAGAAEEAPKEEKKEEEEDVDMGGLFGGDDDY